MVFENRTVRDITLPLSSIYVVRKCIWSRTLFVVEWAPLVIVPETSEGRSTSSGKPSEGPHRLWWRTPPSSLHPCKRALKPVKGLKFVGCRGWCRCLLQKDREYFVPSWNQPPWLQCNLFTSVRLPKLLCVSCKPVCWRLVFYKLLAADRSV